MNKGFLNNPLVGRIGGKEPFQSSFYHKNCTVMATKQRISKQRQNTKEQDEMRKFLLIVVGATLALMVLMYFIFR